MTLTRKLLLLAVVLVAALAFALPSNITKILNLAVGSNLWVGSASEITAGNAITHSLSSSAAIDFATATTTCTESSGITVTGAQAGDPCFVGMPTDAGAGVTNASYTCYVSAANTVTVRHCAAGTADDPGSAIFNVRVVSNQ